MRKHEGWDTGAQRISGGPHRTEAGGQAVTDAEGGAAAAALASRDPRCLKRDKGRDAGRRDILSGFSARWRARQRGAQAQGRGRIATGDVSF